MIATRKIEIKCELWYNHKKNDSGRRFRKGGGECCGQIRSTAAIFWTQCLSARAGGLGGWHFSGAGRAGHHAHRRGQVHLLSGSGAAAAGAHTGRLSADFADEGPGGRADCRRGPRRLPQQLPEPGGRAAGMERPAPGRLPAALCSPGAPGKSALCGAGRWTGYFPRGGR